MGNRFARAALLLALAFFPLGCGASPPTGGAPAARATSAGATGDWFVVPIDSDPATLNFLTGTDVYQAMVARYVADSLVDEGPDLQPVPRLAASWEFSADRKTLTFHLRPGVRWQDGAPFTARDVVFTYRRIQDPETGASSLLEPLLEVADVSAPDDHTVLVSYREPTVLALSSWQFPILAEHLFREGNFRESPVHRSPVGTGPFRFVSWTRGREIILAANPDYFRGRPRLDGIVLKIIPAPSTKLQALLTGESDWSPIPPEEWESRRRSPDFRRRFTLVEYTALFLYYIAWNEKAPYFSDPRVRAAMTLSLDREGYLRKVYRGAGTLAASSFHPAQLGFAADISPLPFDPVRAGQLLDEAGWRRGPADRLRRRQGREFRFRLMIFQGNPVQEQIATLLQEGLARNGVHAEVQILDFPALLTRLRAGDFEAAISAWSLTVDPDPTPFFHSDPARGTSNYVHYADPEMDKLLEEGRRAFDPDRRRAVYHRVQEILHRDQPYTFLFFPKVRIALDARFRGVRASAAAGPLRFFPGILDWHVPPKLQKRRHL